MIREQHNWSRVRGEEGVSLITVMMVLLIMSLMGVSIVTITGFGRQVASSFSANEALTDAAESCVSTGANVLQQSLQAHAVPASLLANAVPPGPVPVANLAVLNGELINDGGNLDFPIGVGSAPNLVMPIGNYLVFGDIDRMYIQCNANSCDPVDPASRFDIFYQITCVATNLATGTTSQVGALYACHNTGAFCQPKPY